METLIVRMLAVLGIFFSGSRRVEVSTPVVEMRQGRLAVSCLVEHPLSDDLQNIIDSGTPVSMTYICRLRNADGSPAFAPDTTITHRVVRDLASGTYEIVLGGRTLLASRFTGYSLFFRLETLPLWSLEVLNPSASYFVEISVRMEPIYVHATEEQYNLMALWNFRAPKSQSAIFNKRALERGQVGP